jgi:hypothetical protein
MKIAIAAVATAAALILGPIVAAAAGDHPKIPPTPTIQVDPTDCDWGWQHQGVCIPPGSVE